MIINKGNGKHCLTFIKEFHIDVNTGYIRWVGKCNDFQDNDYAFYHLEDYNVIKNKLKESFPGIIIKPITRTIPETERNTGLITKVLKGATVYAIGITFKDDGDEADFMF